MSEERTKLLEELEETIKEQLDVEPETITLSATFTDELGADSLAIVELVLALEERFDITIPDEDAESIRTVGDALDYIEAHKRPTRREAS